MMRDALFAELLRDWLTGRSIARGLPAPVPDRGGLRVDTNSATETRRWVFTGLEGVSDLARTIDAPGHVIKACVPDDALRAVLPDRWQLEAAAYVMIGGAGAAVDRPLADGYVVEVERTDAVTAVRIRSGEGNLAARGFGAETERAFVYDRIETDIAHRRKGLGSAVMGALDGARSNRTIPALLVATPAGRALYETLGWRTIAPYATASIG